MKKSLKCTAFMVATALCCLIPEAQGQYSDFKSMSQRITKLATDYPGLCSVRSLAKTAGGKDIWAITVGTGEKEGKPAIAVVSGVDGSYLAGPELAVGFAESILKESASTEIKAMLDKTTWYILPNVSPDATEQYFAGLKYERSINASATDDDRDFKNGEDPLEDLNNDGYITFIRVHDPAGSMVESDEDKRILLATDLSKGQKGIYTVYTEGVDNDKDGLFNEDGPGGVSFNRNFTYNYEEFGQNSGFHAVSETESRAVADFLYDHFNIYAVMTYGPQDNLGQSQTARGSSERQSQSVSSATTATAQPQQAFQMSGRQTGDRRITSVMRTDETVNRLVADKYREMTGVKGSPPLKQSPGNFADWAYYHYGRYSFSTPAWWPPVDRGKNTEAAFLKYAEENKLGEPFIAWTEIKHPDFPGKKVEVGGIKPFSMLTPPADKLQELVQQNAAFLKALSAMQPELQFLDTKVENLGEGISRISVKVHNRGILATCAEIGDNNQWTRIMRISLELASGQTLLSGQKIQRISRLEGGKSSDFTWLISGRGSVKITAGALNTGTINTTLELK